MSATTTGPQPQAVTAPPGGRQWLAVAGLVLVLACLLPPLVLLAHRYVLAETIQFTVFASTYRWARRTSGGSRQASTSTSPATASHCRPPGGAVTACG